MAATSRESQSLLPKFARQGPNFPAALSESQAGPSSREDAVKTRASSRNPRPAGFARGRRETLRASQQWPKGGYLSTIHGPPLAIPGRPEFARKHGPPLAQKGRPEFARGRREKAPAIPGRPGSAKETSRKKVLSY